MPQQPTSPQEKRTLTTRDIAALHRLGEPVGSNWIDWAVQMLVQGHDSHSLAVLAGESEPFNQFEMNELVAKALAELAVQVPATREEALSTFVESDVRALAEGVGVPSAILPRLARLCLENNYIDALFDFYLLDSAVADLQSDPIQRCWPGATRENIDEVIVEYSRRWLLEQVGTRSKGTLKDE